MKNNLEVILFQMKLNQVKGILFQMKHRRVQYEIVPASDETPTDDLVRCFDMEFFWMKGAVLSTERMKAMIEAKRDYFCKRYDDWAATRTVPKESIPLTKKSGIFRNFFDSDRVSNISSGTSVRVSEQGLRNIRSGNVCSYAGGHKKFERTFAPWYWVDWNTTPENLSNCVYNTVPKEEIYRFLFDKCELSDVSHYCLIDKIIERAIRKIARRCWRCSVFCSILVEEYEKGTINVVSVDDVKSEVSIVVSNMIEKGEISAYYGDYGKYSDNSDGSDIILVFSEYESVIDEKVITRSSYGNIVKAITNFAARCQRYNDFAGERLYVIDKEDEETEYFDSEKEYFEKVREDVDLSDDSLRVAQLREEIGHIGRFYHKMAPEYHEEFEYWLIGKLLGYNLKETAELYEVSYKRMLKARDLWQNGVTRQKKGKKYRSEPLFKLYTRKYRKIK